ncbi:MAG: apolipoprotein N-acyltransferase [Planctomycetia bacterium]|nr:apolipoprotein N-acyltransferase [Planctomycetia bacterium]
MTLLPLPAGPRTWLLAIAGAAAMFLVQPPADLWPLAWAAPLPWLLLAVGPRPAGRHPWLVIWTGGLVHWLLALHWLRLPHPATAIGWVALSAYLACYVVLFVWTTRRLVHRWGWPLVLAAPVAWMGCEHLRGWVLGGFTFAGLGHTQWRWTMLVQLADAFSTVGVGGVVMAGAAGLVGLLTGGTWRARAVAAGCGLVVPAVALAYGAWRLATAPPADDRPLDVLLVQGSIDTELKHDPDAAADVARHYDDLTRAGLAEGEAPGGSPAVKPDLVVWPETMWRFGLVAIDPAEVLPEGVVTATLGAAESDPADPATRQARCRRALEQERLDALAAFARRYGTHWLVGLDRQEVTPGAPGGARHYNAAVFLDAVGTPRGCYDKMHPVLFGETIPLGDVFPWLYRLTPLPAGLTPGRRPLAVEIAGHRVAANICYETALPGAVRALVRTLAREGRRPDVLVNLTNDGWFWGSSELDMHLACGIFRAVEVRTPLLIAANTGFSASIDASGRLLARGPRRDTATLRAAAARDGRWSPWLVWGAVPTGGCVAVVAAALLGGLVEWKAGTTPAPDALTGLPIQG